MTIGELIRQAEDIISKTLGSTSARSDAEVLMSHVLKIPRNQILFRKEEIVSTEKNQEFLGFVNERALTKKPIAYIVGETEFYGFPFRVGPGVLIPRPETEWLVEEAVKFGAKTAVDLGSGSGCIAISLAKASGIRVVAVESSSAAQGWLKQNIALNGVGDLVFPAPTTVESLDIPAVQRRLDGRIDVVVANPPYIDQKDPAVESAVRLFEPAEALFSEEDGLKHIRLWARVSALLLRSGGQALFEIGYQQGNSAKKIFEALKLFDEVAIVRDYGDHDRYVRARRR